MKRPSIQLSPTLAGKTIQIGLVYSDHSPTRTLCGVFVDQHAVGSYGRETHHAVARLASLALARGASAVEVADVLRGTEGGPAGKVEGVEGITEALSVADLLGRVLEAFR